MRALSNLISVNNPELVLFVGEALVGNDAVDQLTKFNQRLLDLAAGNKAHAIDGILLTKFDTIDDKVRDWSLVAPSWKSWRSEREAVGSAKDLVFRSVEPPNAGSMCVICGCRPAGWGCPLHGVHIWRSHHVCGLWTNVCGPQEARCQICGAQSAQVGWMWSGILWSSRIASAWW